MKKRKVTAILLSAVLAFGLVACGGSSSGGASTGSAEASTAAAEASAPAAEASTAAAEATEATAPAGELAGPFKIGVATIFEGEQWEIQRNYFVNELGPALNMEFMFSERINDANALMDFIDQAFAADCDGILSFRTQGEDVAQAARKCEDYGMYYVTQNSKVADEVAGLSYNVGHCGADPVKMGAAYKELFAELLSDGEPHSLFLYSCGAVGRMADSHYYSSTAILEAYQEAYGLTYEKSIDEMLNTQEPQEWATGRDDVKIYIFPGIDWDAAAIAAQAQLQTGDYDTFAACAQWQIFSTGIDEVERSLGKDIRIVGTVNIDDQTQTGFASQDSFGNQLINAGMVNPLCPADAINCIELYNALAGGAEQMKEGGNAVLVGVAPFVCMDSDTYNGITQLDRSADTYIINKEDISKLLVTTNPSVTWKDIDAYLNEIADIDYVLSSRGIQ